MLQCDCPACGSRRRRSAMASYYMAHFGMSHPEAVEALAHERRLMWAAALSAMSERHGLDDGDALSWVLTHAINPPLMMQ
jgi:hypothetical protein